MEEDNHQQRNHQQTTEEGEGGSGSYTNSTQDLSGTTTKWWRNYSEQTTEQEQERILKTLYTWKNKLQHNLPTPAQQNTRCGGWSGHQLTSWRETPTKENTKTIKTQRCTKSQHKQQPKTSELRRLRRPHHWISQVFYHRSSHQKPRETEQINLRGRG